MNKADWKYQADRKDRKEVKRWIKRTTNKLVKGDHLPIAERIQLVNKLAFLREYEMKMGDEPKVELSELDRIEKENKILKAKIARNKAELEKQGVQVRPSHELRLEKQMKRTNQEVKRRKFKANQRRKHLKNIGKDTQTPPTGITFKPVPSRLEMKIKSEEECVKVIEGIKSNLGEEKYLELCGKHGIKKKEKPKTLCWADVQKAQVKKLAEEKAFEKKVRSIADTFSIESLVAWRKNLSLLLLAFNDADSYENFNENNLKSLLLIDDVSSFEKLPHIERWDYVESIEKILLTYR